MQNLKDYLPLLSKATTRNNIPFYGSMIKFSEGKVETCNNLVHTTVNISTPFRGCVNFFTFEKILKSLSDKAEITQSDHHINIKDGQAKYKLEIDDVDFPEINLGNMSVIEVNEELYYKLNLAKLYTSKTDEIQSHPYIYLSNNEIISTNNSKAFYSTVATNIDTPIPISKEALTLAKIGDKIGVVDTNSENNFILISNNAQVKFTGRADIRNTFPATPIRDFINTNKKKYERLCPVNSLKNAIQKVSYVLVNEKKPIVKVDLNNKIVCVSAESFIGGEASIIINIGTDSQGNFVINPNLLNGIPETFYVYIDKSGIGRRLILIDNDIYILLACD